MIAWLHWTGVSTNAFKSRARLAAYILAPSVLAAVVIIGCLSMKQPRPGSTFRDCGECPLMVVMPTGSFVMGDSLYGPPPHRVTIRTRFAVTKDLITRREREVNLISLCVMHRGRMVSSSLIDG